MNIQLHIERLILDGLPVTPHQGQLVRAAAETELARLLTENGLATHLQAGGSMPILNATGIQLAPSGSPAQMGRQIAQSIYSGLGNTR